MLSKTALAGSREGTWLLPGTSSLFRVPGFLIPVRTGVEGPHHIFVESL
jgi:hypothetical protein